LQTDAVKHSFETSQFFGEYFNTTEFSKQTTSRFWLQRMMCLFHVHNKVDMLQKCVCFKPSRLSGL